jgi:hypothetical protein
MFVLTVVAGAVLRAPVAPQLMHFWIFRCCQSLVVLKSLQIKFGFLRDHFSISPNKTTPVSSIYTSKSNGKRRSRSFDSDAVQLS